MVSELPRALVRHLENNHGLSALLVSRIYPLELPQEPVLPAMTYQQVSGQGQADHTGETGYHLYRYQFDVFAPTYLALVDIANALKLALQQWHYANNRYASFYENEQDFSEPEQNRYRRTLDYMIEEEA